MRWSPCAANRSWHSAAVRSGLCLSIAASLAGCASGAADSPAKKKPAHAASPSDEPEDDAPPAAIDAALPELSDAAIAQSGARPSVLEGSWYPSDPAKRDKLVLDLIERVEAGDKIPAAGIVVPHASLHYSGATAAEAYARLAAPTTIVLMAPDHSGGGEPVAVWTDGPWLLPGAIFEIDHQATDRLIQLIPDLVSDRVAFNAHEAEMQLPFIHVVAPAAKLIVVSMHDNSRLFFKDFDVERVERFGAGLAKLYRELTAKGERVTMISSVDMTHHEPLTDVETKDPPLAEHIGALDVQGLYDYVTTKKISICGEIPTSVLMSALRQLGYDALNELALNNSYSVAMDETDVVGYLAAATWTDDPMHESPAPTLDSADDAGAP